MVGVKITLGTTCPHCETMIVADVTEVDGDEIDGQMREAWRTHAPADCLAALAAE